MKPYVDNHDIDAMIVYGDMLWRGAGIKENKEEAIRYFVEITENESNIDNMIRFLDYQINNYSAYYDNPIESFLYTIMQKGNKEQKDKLLNLMDRRINDYCNYGELILKFFNIVTKKGTSKEKDKLFDMISKNQYLSSHNWIISNDFNLLRLKFRTMNLRKNYEALRYYKIIVNTKEETEKTINKYKSFREENGEIFDENGSKISKDEEFGFKSYKKALENKWDIIEDAATYAEIVYNTDGIREEEKKDAIKYYKMAIDNNNFRVFKLNDNIDLINELFEYIKDKNLSNKDLIYDENGRVKGIKDILHEDFKGEEVIRSDKEFEYDENGKIIGIVSKAYHRDDYEKEEKLPLYEVKNIKNTKEEKYTYYLDDGIELKATVDAKGIIKFNFDEINLTSEQLKEKTDRILNSFGKHESAFDLRMSYLAYAPLQLQLKNEVEEDNVIFNTDCQYNVDGFSNVVYDSLKEENEDKIYICDLGILNHTTQAMISNGDIIIFNTGSPYPYDKLLEEINKNIDEITEQNREDINVREEKKKKVNISEYRSSWQNIDNCILASKTAMSDFLMEKLLARGNNINSLPQILEDTTKTIENSTEEVDILDQVNEEQIEEMKIELLAQMLNNDVKEKRFLTLDNKYEETIDKLYRAVRERDKNNEYVVDSIDESSEKTGKTEKERLENAFNKLLMVESFFREHGKEKNDQGVSLS